MSRENNRKIYHRLVSLNGLFSIIEKYYPLKPLGIEVIDVSNALHRVLAEDIYAPIDHPPFDRSEVDGYAVKASNVMDAYEDRPVELSVKGYVAAGLEPKVIVSDGEAVEIATGAMIPRGADAVVMEEYTVRKGGNVLIYKSVYPGENITTAGSDISAGDLLLLRGTVLTHREIGLLAGMGIKHVKVYKRPRIAVFSTGNEVIEPGEKLQPGKVFDVNGYLITAIARESGADARYYGLLPDDFDVMYQKIKNALSENDIVVTSGGTSAGLGDLIYRVFDKLGEPGVIVHGVKVKPGKPTVVAVADGKLLLGLPGFPLSCYMIAFLVLKPIIEKISGIRRRSRTEIYAKLAIRVRKNLGRTWLLPASLIHRGGEYIAYPVATKSGSISPLINSDGYVVLEEGRDLYLENEKVKVVLFRDLSRIPNFIIIGSNDVLLYRILVETGLIEEAKVIVTGSLGGWYAVKKGEADIAPTHLLDEETGLYNVPFIKKVGLEDRAVLVRGYDRRIGIVVEKGNPKGIRSIEDFIRKDIIIVNRTKGSGARVLLDINLKKIAKEKNIPFNELVKKINGYTYEVKTHTAVAAAVKHKRADAGIAIEIVAKMYDLDFIPLAWEHYDFLVHKESMDKQCVKQFINSLKRSEIRKIISDTPGYRVPEDIGEVITSLYKF